jgi:hypothetical protein
VVLRPGAYFVAPGKNGFGIFFIFFEQQQFSHFGGPPHLCFFWSSTVCLNIKLVYFLLKMFTINSISGGFFATEQMLVTH